MPLAYAEDSGGADDVTAGQTTQDGSDGQTQDQEQEQPPEAEGDTPAEDENPADDSPAEVGTLEYLQAAIDAAEEGQRPRKFLCNSSHW